MSGVDLTAGRLCSAEPLEPTSVSNTRLRPVIFPWATVIIVVSCVALPLLSLYTPRHIGLFLQVLALFSLGLVGFQWARGTLRLGKRLIVVVAAVLLVLAMALWSAINNGSTYDAGQRILQEVQPALGLGPSAIDRAVALDSIGLIAPTALLGWCIAALCRSAVDRAGVLVSLVLLTALLGVFGLIGHGIGNNLATNARHPESAFGWFRSHGHAGSFLLMGVMCAAAVTGWCARHRWVCLLGAAVAGFLLFCLLFINLSEAAAGITLLVLTGWAWLAGLRRALGRGGLGRSVLYSAVSFSVVVILACTAVLMGAEQHLEKLLQASGMTGRMRMWESAWPIARDAGLFGYGPGSFKVLLPISDSLAQGLTRNWILTPYMPDEPITVWNHAHNDYIQSMVEWGLLGVAVWVGLIVMAMARLLMIAWRSPNRRDAVLAAGASAALVGVLLHAMIDAPFQSPMVLLVIAVLVGLGWSWDSGAALRPKLDARAES